MKLKYFRYLELCAVEEAIGQNKYEEGLGYNLILWENIIRKLLEKITDNADIIDLLISNES